jgi:hypothetical protein
MDSAEMCTAEYTLLVMMMMTLAYTQGYLEQIGAGVLWTFALRPAPTASCAEMSRSTGGC